MDIYLIVTTEKKRKTRGTSLLIFLALLNVDSDKRYWKQGVKLLAKPVGVGESCSSAVIEASFNPSSGDLDITHAFS